MKTNQGGTRYYDRDKFMPELPEDMVVGDMSYLDAGAETRRYRRSPT